LTEVGISGLFFFGSFAFGELSANRRIGSFGGAKEMNSNIT
jgi:hypothetical protein